MPETTFTLDQVMAVMQMLETTRKHDPASTTLTAPTLHGPFHGNTSQFGIFSTPGVRPDRFSALVRPPSGLARVLGLSKSRFYQEKLEVMTGVTASAGTNATGWCGNPPTVGQGKVCRQNYNWGKYYVKTDLNAIPEVGQLRDRADVPANILNDGPQANPLIPDLMYRLDDSQSQLKYELWRIGVSTERSLDRVLITGDDTVASAAAEHGWITEMDGLDLQIKTGYTDADTGIACPAMDSAIITFGADVAGTIGGGDGRNLVQAGTDLVWATRDRGTEMLMDGVQLAWVMRKEAFRAVVEQWACDYATYRCNSSNAGLPFNRDVENTNALRLEMMNGQYLKTDAEDIPVIFSEGIPREGLAANTFQTDLYLVPISWQGLPLLRLEYFPLDDGYVQEFANFVNEGKLTTLNNGLWGATYRSTGFCLEYHFAAKMRLILETPFLAGRLDNVQFEFRTPIRNSDPSDTYFYPDGGVTYVS